MNEGFISPQYKIDKKLLDPYKVTAVQVLPALEDDARGGFERPIVRIKPITGSQDNNGTIVGTVTTQLGVVEADGQLKGMTLTGSTFGATVNAAMRCRLEVQDPSTGQIVFALHVQLAGPGQQAVSSCAPDLPVPAGCIVNLVSTIDQTAPCRTRFFAYVAIQPYR